MADTIDISGWADAPAEEQQAQQLLQQQQQPQAQQQQQSQPAGVDISNWKEMPSHANGLSENAPINKSPLTIEQRYDLALGNKKGNVSKLKSMFEDAKEIKDGPLKGDLMVKQGGLWHTVDSHSLGEVDPWKLTTALSVGKGLLASVQSTADILMRSSKQNKYGPKEDLAVQGLTRGDEVAKETASEVTEKLPMAAAAGLGVAAGMLTGGVAPAVGFWGTVGAMTPQAVGAGIAAGSAELARTSLGRMEGTYEASPETQLADIATESLINAAGVYIANGVKPTAAWMGSKLDKMGTGWRSLPEKSKDILKNAYGSWSNVGEALEANSVDPVGMKEAYKRATDGYKGSINKAKTNIVLDNTEQIKDAGFIGKSWLKQIYGKTEDELIQALPANHKSDPSGLVADVFKALHGEDLVKVTQRPGAGGAYTPVEVIKDIFDNGGKLPPEIGFRLPSHEAIIQQFQKTGNPKLADIALNKETYDGLKEVVQSLQLLQRVAPNSGNKEATRQMLKFNRALSDLTYKLGESGRQDSVNGLTALMSKIHQEMVEPAVAKQFANHSPQAEQLFKAMNENYKSLRQPLSQLVDAVDKSRDVGDAAFEQLANRLGTRAGNETGKKDFNLVVALAKKYGLAGVDRFQEAQRRIYNNNMAIQFVPAMGSSFMSQGAIGGGISTVFYNPLAAAGLGLVAATKSPMVNYHGQNALRAAGKLLQPAWQAKEFMGKLGANMTARMLADPEMTNAFVSTITNAPYIENDVEQKLLSPLMGGGQQQ